MKSTFHDHYSFSENVGTDIVIHIYGSGATPVQKLQKN